MLGRKTMSPVEHFGIVAVTALVPIAVNDPCCPICWILNGSFTVMFPERNCQIRYLIPTSPEPLVGAGRIERTASHPKRPPMNQPGKIDFTVC
jgi:hypothetical protein